jgi:hypothetical protein
MIGFSKLLRDRSKNKRWYFFNTLVIRTAAQRHTVLGKSSPISAHCESERITTIQNRTTTTNKTNESSENENEQHFPEMKQKTIARHMKKIVKYYRNHRVNWTGGNIAAFMFKAAFWIPIYLFGGYLTISTSIGLIEQYLENPIYLSMTAMINQPYVLIPNYTACGLRFCTC